MNYKKLLYTPLLTASLALIADPIEEQVNNVLPEGMKVESISDSSVDGIKVVDIGDMQPIYVTDDGKYFFYGTLYGINGTEIENITDIDKSSKRAKIMSSNLTNKDFISFPAANPKHTITVFTDVDCGYCRQFHSEINDYNELGISVNYVAFPRSGPDTESYDKIVGAWCSVNPKQILTEQKLGNNPDTFFCKDHPVKEHYLLGQRIGVTGTPAIITESGVLLPGYLPPDDLLLRLKSYE
tara:strand:- start:3164 stop:3883 length:720 start_codon:yes stop_codon:yes gene_type:complete